MGDGNKVLCSSRENEPPHRITPCQVRFFLHSQVTTLGWSVLPFGTPSMSKIVFVTISQVREINGLNN